MNYVQDLLHKSYTRLRSCFRPKGEVFVLVTFGVNVKPTHIKPLTNVMF